MMDEQPREFEIPPPGAAGPKGPTAPGQRRFRRSASGSVEAPTLGYVPAAVRAPIPVIAEPGGAAATAYAQAVERLQASNTDDLFLVGAATKGDRPGDVALNLAAAGTLEGLRVVLIDADGSGRGPTRYLRTGSGPGLSELAAGTADLDTASRLMRLGDGRTLPVIPAGSDLADADLATSHLADAIDRITEHSDLVLVAIPPSDGTAGLAALGAHADGTILAVGEGEAKRAIAQAAEQLADVGAPVIGIIEQARIKRAKKPRSR